MSITPAGASIPEVTHHRVDVNGAEWHYVSAGSAGSPVLLVHGFPETWWAFRGLIPRLAQSHRVFAVDLRGFGDSDAGEGDSRTLAEGLRSLIGHLGVGAVHLTGQDISGPLTFRLVAEHPESVRSYTAIETGLPGFGLEGLADVTRGGAWYIGMLVAPGAPELLLSGRERELFGELLFPAATVDPVRITDADVREFARAYSRPDGFAGARGLYSAMLREGNEIRALALDRPLQVPVLAVGAGSGAFTAETMVQVTAFAPRSVVLEGVGHYAALEAPDAVADALLGFFGDVDTR